MSSRAQRIRSERQTITMQLDAEVKKQEEERWRVREAERDKYYDQKFILQKQLRKQQQLQQKQRVYRADAVIADGLRTGMIYSIDIDFNEVRINPVLWMSSDLETKQSLVMSFSRYFEMKGSTRRVTVRSSLNDTKMATYGSWGGLKILF